MSEFDLAVALSVWSLGAGLYTWQLWTTRGLSDTGVAGLVILVVGGGLVGVVVARVSLGAGVLLATSASVFPVVILWLRAVDKVRYYERLVHERMGRPAPRAVGPPEAVTGAERPSPPSWHPPGAEVMAEQARAERIGRMFGG